MSQVRHPAQAAPWRRGGVFGGPPGAAGQELPSPQARLLAQVPLFAALTAEELAGLAALLSRRRYAKGEVIFHQGDAGTALYIVEEGGVKIVLGSEEGKEVILALLGRGDFFGELALLDGEPRSADAVARDATQLLALRRDDFLRFVLDKPRVAASLLAVLSRRLRRTDQLVHDAAFLDVRGRLARVLLELAEAQGRPEPAGVAAGGTFPVGAAAATVVLAARLTQGELAEMVGATRESINKWLGFYTRRGVLRFERGRLTLMDLQRLRQDSGSDA